MRVRVLPAFGHNTVTNPVTCILCPASFCLQTPYLTCTDSVGSRAGEQLTANARILSKRHITAFLCSGTLGGQNHPQKALHVKTFSARLLTGQRTSLWSQEGASGPAWGTAVSGHFFLLHLFAGPEPPPPSQMPLAASRAPHMLWPALGTELRSSHAAGHLPASGCDCRERRWRMEQGPAGTGGGSGRASWGRCVRCGEQREWH